MAKLLQTMKTIRNIWNKAHKENTTILTDIYPSFTVSQLILITAVENCIIVSDGLATLKLHWSISYRQQQIFQG